MSSWDSFKAFGGRLDSSFLKTPLDSQNKPDYKAAILSFTQWIQGLRQSPHDYGIPQDRIKDVIKLLDAFFPQPEANQRIEPRRIRSESGAPVSLRRIVPVEVQLGPKNASLLISDAPNALGYIFSVVAPLSPETSTFENYHLPLAVCYAWFIYLAFLWPTSSPACVITNVPNEACVMYLSGSVNRAIPGPIFYLGHTWSGADPADAYGAGMKINDETEMDRWRRGYLVESAFARDSTAQIPNWAPSGRRIAARRLNEYILGKKGIDPQATPFLEPLFAGNLLKLPGTSDNIGLPEYIKAVSTMVMADAKQPLATTTEPDFLISHSKLGPVLMELLYTMVENLPTIADQAKLLDNLQKLVRFYITPHVFDPTLAQELPLGQLSKPLVDGLASALPILLLDGMQKKLQSLKCHLDHVHESKDDKIRFIEESYFIDNKSYGRCPEAIPVYTLWYVLSRH